MATTAQWALRGLTAAKAAWKPAPARHSIWQIVRHLILWKRGVLDAWDGDPPDGNQLAAGARTIVMVGVLMSP